MVRDPDLAEDVCQDALFRVWQHLDECREPDRFRSWLVRAVHRHALNALRGRSRLGEPLDDQMAGTGPGTDRRALDAELRGRLTGALDQLPAEQRLAVLMFDLEGWSHAEIAERLETTEAMSRQHLMLGRRRLRALLPREESP